MDKKKQSVLDMSKYMDKEVRVKFMGGREVVGVLKGYDALLNLVLDETKTVAALDVFSNCFLRILDGMDKANGVALQQILEAEMAPEDDFVRAVLRRVPSRKGKA